MELSGLTKLIVCSMVIIAATVLLAMGKIPDVAGVSLLTGALGYVFGNGHGIMSATKTSTKKAKYE
jgi:proteasome assembly chaperone (PAC2) family protein